MKIVCEVRINGVDQVKVVTTANNANHGLLVKTLPGVGKPFWLWPSVPSGKIIAADFTDAPIVSSDIQENLAAIEAITSAPEDVLTFE